MDLHAILLTSWERLRELLETADSVRQNYHAATAACIMKTDDEYLKERALFFKKKHGYTKQSQAVVRLSVVTKEMHTHSMAIYRAWESMASLQLEYEALEAVQKEKALAAADRDYVSQQRMAVKEEAAAKNRAITLAKMQKKGIDLGEVGGAEDQKDALADEEAERIAERANAKQEAEQKEEQRKSAIRTHIVTSYNIDEASQLLAIVQHLKSHEAEAYLISFNAKRNAKKAPPPPPVPVVQPAAPFASPQTVLNSLLDHDNYDERSSQKSITRKKNKNRGLSGSDSESDVSVHFPDSPRKEQRMSDLSNDMQQISLAKAGG